MIMIITMYFHLYYRNYLSIKRTIETTSLYWMAYIGGHYRQVPLCMCNWKGNKLSQWNNSKSNYFLFQNPKYKYSKKYLNTTNTKVHSHTITHMLISQKILQSTHPTQSNHNWHNYNSLEPLTSLEPQTILLLHPNY